MGYREYCPFERFIIMPADRAIVYIRAVDRRPLYIKFTGEYRLVTRFLSPTLREGRCHTVEHDGYVIHIGDIAEIFALKRAIKIEIGHDTELTDEPKLAKHGYPFAA